MSGFLEDLDEGWEGQLMEDCGISNYALWGRTWSLECDVERGARGRSPNGSAGHRRKYEKLLPGLGEVEVRVKRWDGGILGAGS